MTVWILEIDAPASVVMVDLPLFRLCGVGPISQRSLVYPPEYLIEQAHLPGALNIPHDAVDTLAPRLVSNKDAEIVVY
jgi:hypothetical protein